MLSLVFAVLGVVFFLLDAFNVPASVKWTPLGFACVTVAAFIV